MAKTYFSLGADNAAESWREIRSHRAAPSTSLKRKLKGHRKQVFHMALEQSQQQFEAAAAIGYESRPLNLFYGLAQAGRAICAASDKLGPPAKGDLETWLPQGGHGLSFRTTLSRDSGLLGERVTLQQSRSDSFSRLSNALSSPLAFDGIAFGALLAQVPEVWLQFRCLDWGPAPLLPNGLSGIELMSFPVRWDLDAPGLDVIDGLTRDAAMAWLDQYPAIRALNLLVDDEGKPIRSQNRGHIQLQCPTPDSLRDVGGGYFFPSGAQVYRGNQAIFPGVGLVEPLHPLATWWMLLFALSMLARYSPSDWAEVMSLERSPIASAIEFVLDEALAAVPNLVAETLDTLND